MKRNVLGNTGIEVSELSYGTLIFAEMQANLTLKEGGRSVKKALDSGINFFDRVDNPQKAFICFEIIHLT